MLEKAQAFLDARGIEPGAVPLKVLAPLLQAASFEDENDDDMIARWAALLANAAAGDEGASVPPAFPAILAQLVPIEAVILDTLHRLQEEHWVGSRFVQAARADSVEVGPEQEGEGTAVADVARECGVAFDDTFLLSVEDLERHQLVYVPVPSTFGGGNELHYRQFGLVNGTARLMLTNLGRAFVRACQWPTGAQTGAQGADKASASPG
jgi:hypothetical protein